MKLNIIILFKKYQHIQFFLSLVSKITIINASKSLNTSHLLNINTLAFWFISIYLVTVVNMWTEKQKTQTCGILLQEQRTRSMANFLCLFILYTKIKYNCPSEFILQKSTCNALINIELPLTFMYIKKNNTRQINTTSRVCISQWHSQRPRLPHTLGILLA